MVLAFTRLDNTLAASQSATPITYAGFTGYVAGAAHIPDAKYDAVLAQLRAPAGFTVQYSGGDMDRFKDSCPDPDLTKFLTNYWVVNYTTYGMFNDDLLPIASTSGTCSSSVGVLQPPRSLASIHLWGLRG